MISRSTLLATLLTLTFLAGLALFYTHESSSDAGMTGWTPIKNFFGTTKQELQPTAVAEDLRARIARWASVPGKVELGLYVFLALIAGSLIAFVVTRTSRAPLDPKDTLLEVLKEEKQRAENSAKIKSEFLNHVSHELRTPLAVIIGYIECITDGLYGQLGSKHQEILDIVAKQSSHLKEMIDQILIYSRLDSNRHSIHLQEFSLNAVLSDLKETFGFLCAQKGLDLSWELTPESLEIQSDPAILKEILSNLLQNAVKYTDLGSISITVRHIPENHSITLAVSDSGLGIPEEYLSTVFEPFVQVHKTSTDRSRGGIGLGLSIVKKHVELIKGKITVTSQVGKGSRFTVTVPERFERQHLRQKELFQLFRLPSLRTPKIAGVVPPQAPADAKNRTQAVG
jgi:signal transduction histidine kinase